MWGDRSGIWWQIWEKAIINSFRKEGGTNGGNVASTIIMDEIPKAKLQRNQNPNLGRIDPHDIVKGFNLGSKREHVSNDQVLSARFEATDDRLAKRLHEDTTFCL